MSSRSFLGSSRVLPFDILGVFKSGSSACGDFAARAISRDLCLRLGVVLFGPVLWTGCSSPQVAVRSGYDFRQIKRVALLGFEDSSNFKGSGDIVASTFEKTLLQAGYQVIERRRVDQILHEQSLVFSGALDPNTMRRVGGILGVDALVLGSLTTFTPERKSVMLVDVNEDIEQPILQRQVVQERQGDQTVTVERNVIAGYRQVHKSRKVPEEFNTSAEVGLAVRMVNVQTAEVLWSASWSKSASNVERAVESLSDRIMKALRPTWPSNPNP